MVKIRTTVPVLGDRKEWLDEHYPIWDIAGQHKENDMIGNHTMIIRTHWYIELPNKLATMYLLKYSRYGTVL